MATRKAKRPPKAVTGSFSVPREAVLHVRPSDGFDRAFETALAKAARQWDKPQEVDVEVVFEAQVHVWNPGGVGVYSVTLKPKGGGTG